MTKPKVMVLRTAGTNCDAETCHAFEVAGAVTQKVHVNRLIENPALLDDFQILALPGGFSYGDDIAAGKILANQLIHHFRDAVRRFINADKLVLGICNGFQVLVKAGLLGSATADGNAKADITRVTITYNDSGKFEDRWVHLRPGTDKCVFLDAERRLYLPIAHGEGKVVFRDETLLKESQDNGLVALRYVDANGAYCDYPINPNGSTDHIAGLCDATGRVLGLMPHPERHIHRTQHPHWTRLAQDESAGDGLSLFTNAVTYFS